MKLQTLLCFLHDFTAYVGDNPTITSIEMDSREVQKGSLFVCIEGFTVDGHEFAEQAVAQGAAAIVAQKPLNVPVPVVYVNDSRRALAVLADAFYDQPTHKLHLIGVTGTNGKTTTTHIIDHIFRHAGKKTGLIGTVHIKIGDEIYEVKNTTPESVVLQKTFRRMVDERVDVVAMEVSSHALHMGRVHGCDFDVAVFTNLTQDHLDYHRTMDHYRWSKGLLFAQLGNRFDHERPKFAVLNADDEATDEYKKSTAATVITYGIKKKSDVMAKNVTMTATGTAFELVTPLETVRVRTKLVGMFNVYNILAAVSAALVSRVPLNTIVEALQSVEGVAGRLQVIDGPQPFTVIVDYAHTPDSLQNVLQTVRQFAKKRVLVVVGCGGDRDRAKRPLMGNIAVQYADVAIFTSDNPRSEDPLAIIEEMKRGVEGEKRPLCIVDREEAIERAIREAEEGDVVLIAGKGHETYQMIGNNVFHFDDRVVAKRAIERTYGDRV